MRELAAQLKALDFVNWTTVFGAELLWSALPFIILLSSLANERIDDDLSRHIGLSSRGAHVVRGLFRNTPAHSLAPVLTGMLFSFAGIVAVVGSMQTIYERVFEQEHHGWRDLPRRVCWVGALLGALIAEAVIGKPVRATAGPVVQALLTFVLVAIFLGWTMRFLLAGRVPWHLVIRPALATSCLWLVLSIFSSLYFSSVVISDNKTYGEIGVVFTLLTWFILVGGVIVVGTAWGAVWQARHHRDSTAADRKESCSKSTDDQRHGASPA